MTKKVETTPPESVVEDHQPEVVAEEPTPEDITAMQEQLKYQLAQLMKLAKAAGIDPLKDFEKPPTETTVVLERSALFGSDGKQVEASLLSKAEREGRPKPGTVLGNPGDRNPAWVPWSKQDIDPDEWIEFVPQPVPNLVFPLADEHGNQKIRLDVNDLICWLTVGVVNRVNKMFYHVYMDGFGSWKELERFKRHGPDYAPWGRTGPDGRPAWHYEAAALTHGMDDDGHYLIRGGRSPLLIGRHMEGEAEAI